MTSQMEISPSLPFFLSFVFSECEQASIERCHKLGMEASHIGKYHSASEGIFEAHAYRGPPRGSCVCPSGSPVHLLRFTPS